MTLDTPTLLPRLALGPMLVVVAVATANVGCDADAGEKIWHPSRYGADDLPLRSVHCSDGALGGEFAGFDVVGERSGRADCELDGDTLTLTVAAHGGRRDAMAILELRPVWRLADLESGVVYAFEPDDVLDDTYVGVTGCARDAMGSMYEDEAGAVRVELTARPTPSRERTYGRLGFNASFGDGTALTGYIDARAFYY